MKSQISLPALFLLTCLLTLCHVETKAQTAEYTYKVLYRMKDKTEKEAPGFYVYKYDYSDAERIYKTLDKRIKNYQQISQSRAEFAIESTPNGEFSFQGANGMGVVFSTSDEELLIIMHDDGIWANVKKGTTSKGSQFEYKCKKLADKQFEYTIWILGSQLLEEVKVKGEYQSKGGNRSSALDLEDGIERWNYHLELPTSLHENDSRIIILPYAVDCLTEDTVAHLPAAVYEGRDYHDLQVRRKGYNYFENDPLGKENNVVKHHVTYDTIVRPKIPVAKARLDENNRTQYDENGELIKDTIWMDNDSIVKHEWNERTTSHGYIKAIEDLDHVDNKIVIDTLIEFKAPVKKRKYRGVLKIFMEDYHHVYYTAQYPGTCLRITPYKFLQMDNASVDLPLTNEFFEAATDRPSEGGLDLKITFKYNTAEIIEDSLYYVSLDELSRIIGDIRATDGQILDATLESYASPDGPEKRNRELAGLRAKAAMGRISLGNVKINTKPDIDTWANTASLLDEAFFPAEAQFIRDALARTTSNQAAEKEIKKCPTYEEVIKPILQSQCRIVLKFTYWTKRKLNAQEAVVAFRKKPNDIFSNGDYYNMFSIMKDTAEIDKLTEIVYKKLKANYDRPLATYVINKMALLKLRQGRPDTTILAPLIREDGYETRLNRVITDFSGIRTDYKVNRPEILLNQATIFYVMGEENRAKWIVDILSMNGYTSPEMERMKNYINFKTLYKIAPENRSANQQREFEQALHYVENSNEDNRAVLYTEFTELNMTERAWPYVLKMRETNPVRWYLLALLWAKRDGREGTWPLPDIDEVKDLPADVDRDLLVSGYPYYIAYFQKCFEIDKNYMKYYFNEGNVSEDMRKKRNHAYKNNRIPIYKKIYTLRNHEDKKELAKLQEMDESDKKAPKDDNDQKDATE